MKNRTQTIRKKHTVKPISMAIHQQAEMDMKDTLLESTTAMLGIKSLTKAKNNWEPFHSSLFDTVRIIVDSVHNTLDQIALGNTNIKRHGHMWLVRCPATGAVATVISKGGCTQLIIEVSIPKFLTGQNVLGREDLLSGAKKAIGKVFSLMDMPATDDEVQNIRNGQFKLTRVDCVDLALEKRIPC